jgi:membrane protein implicated in regulation of membrane protease activity
MELDVRLPMGSMFLVIGVLLTVVGLFSKADDYALALGINLDLWWGLVMFSVGAVMLLLVWRAEKKGIPVAPLPH